MIFAPDPGRASDLDARMHRQLGQSLQHICEASFGQVRFDSVELYRLIDRLSDGDRLPPAAFACYYQLVPALVDGDAERAASLFAELAAMPLSASDRPRVMDVRTLGDATLGQWSDRYLDMLRAGGADDPGVAIPGPEAAAAFVERLREGFVLLDTALPDLAGEIRALIRQVVIVGSDPDASQQLDGGSHYQLWGALFLNADFHPDAVAVAEVLAHESAHSLLFGLCTDMPLVNNPPDARYPSPLRQDDRPMDGIFHATFVSARMHWTMSRLGASPLLDAAGRAAARRAAAVDAANYHAGYAVVRRHGELTNLGESVIRGAHDYMAATA